MSKSDLVDIPCILKHETDKAYLVDVGELATVWLPKSMCEYHKEGESTSTKRGSHGIITMPEWLAIEKELI